MCLTMNVRTEVSLDSWSTEGRPSQPHTSLISSRTFSCHLGLSARSIIVHVRRSAVVSWPAKKNVLHSSIINWRLLLSLLLFLWLSISFKRRPRRSSPWLLLRPISAQSRLLCMISINKRSTSFFRDFISLLYLLGRNLGRYKHCVISQRLTVLKLSKAIVIWERDTMLVLDREKHIAWKPAHTKHTLIFEIYKHRMLQ